MVMLKHLVNHQVSEQMGSWGMPRGKTVLERKGLSMYFDFLILGARLELGFWDKDRR